MLNYASSYVEKEISNSNQFFEQPFFTENSGLEDILAKMRSNLARNCTLIESSEERVKNKILESETA